MDKIDSNSGFNGLTLENYHYSISPWRNPGRYRIWYQDSAKPQGSPMLIQRATSNAIMETIGKGELGCASPFKSFSKSAWMMSSARSPSCNLHASLFWHFHKLSYHLIIIHNTKFQLGSCYIVRPCKLARRVCWCIFIQGINGWQSSRLAETDKPQDEASALERWNNLLAVSYEEFARFGLPANTWADHAQGMNTCKSNEHLSIMLYEICTLVRRSSPWVQHLTCLATKAKDYMTI